MAVVNGAPVEASYTNSKLMSRTQDTDTTGVVALNNTATVLSGAVVTNAQQALNETFDAVGMTGINDATRKTYSSNNVVSTGDNRKVAIGKLDAKFNSSTGHKHTGAAGDAPQIDAATLSNINLYYAEFQSITKTSASGTSNVITTEVGARNPSGSSSTAGVITDAPFNTCFIINTSTNDFIEDAGGQRVYGRITYSAGVWTITYFTNEAGVETSHSLTSANISIIFREVFTQFTRPTIPSNPLEFGTLDVTADVVDASSGQRGVVSTGTQSFGGAKTFVNTTQSTDKDTGAVIIEGGLGVEKNGNFGGTLLASNLSGTNTGDVTLASFGSTPSASAASLSGQVLTNQPADGSNPGGISLLAQTMGAGVKTFSDTTQSTTKDNGGVVLEGGLGVEKNINAGGAIAATGALSGSNFSGSSSGTNTGDITLGAFGSSANANGASLSGQVLTIQPTDGTFPGAVSTSAQTFGGSKVFSGSLRAQAELLLDSEDSAITGASAAITLPTNTLVRLTSGTLTSVSTAGVASTPQLFYLANTTGNSVTINNDTGTASSIVTGTGSNFTLTNGALVTLVYDFSSSRWRMSGGGSTISTPVSETNGGTGQSTYATGDTLYASASNTLSKRTIGSTGQVLTVAGGVPTWATPTAALIFRQEIPSGTINGSNVTFTLANTPTSTASLIVYINGVMQRQTTQYTISGTTITMVTAPATDSRIDATYSS